MGFLAFSITCAYHYFALTHSNGTSCLLPLLLRLSIQNCTLRPNIWHGILMLVITKQKFNRQRERYPRVEDVQCTNYTYSSTGSYSSCLIIRQRGRTWLSFKDQVKFQWGTPIFDPSVDKKLYIRSTHNLGQMIKSELSVDVPSTSLLSLKVPPHDCVKYEGRETFCYSSFS